MKKTATVTITFDLAPFRLQFIQNCAEELVSLTDGERASVLEEAEIEAFECARDAWDNAEGGNSVAFDYAFAADQIERVTVPVQYSHCQSDHENDTTFDCRWDKDDHKALIAALTT